MIIKSSQDSLADPQTVLLEDAIAEYKDHRIIFFALFPSFGSLCPSRLIDMPLIHFLITV